MGLGTIAASSSSSQRLPCQRQPAAAARRGGCVAEHVATWPQHTTVMAGIWHCDR
jgi:hypothetical protein